MIKVFLSSTGGDLRLFRDASFEAIQTLDGFSCIRMEDFGAVDREPVAHCRDKVAQTDVLVGIVGLNYGSCPPEDDTSFTEHEYNAAVTLKIPRLMFVAPADFPLPGIHRESDTLWQKQQQFRDRVSDELIIAAFYSPEELAKQVLAALSNWRRTGDTSQILRVPEKRWRADLDPPGALLRADFGIVPFHGREQEMQALQSWAESDHQVSISLYTGAGGMGKTRLALEICRSLSDTGWKAGFLEHRDPAITKQRLQRLIGGAERLLAVIDYAETCRDLLVDVISTVRQRDGGKIYLLLLARGAGDWWEALKREGGGVGDIISGPATKRVLLGPLALTLEARRSSYQLACSNLAATLGKSDPQAEPEDIEAPYFEKVLLLHMAALAAVEGIQLKGEDGILDYVLRREQRFWSELATTRGLPPVTAQGIGRAMAAITLGGGASDEAEAIHVLESLAFFKGENRPLLHAVVRLLHDSYPGENWIEPVQPDLLGEHLVEKELAKGENEIFDLVLGPSDLPH